MASKPNNRRPAGADDWEPLSFNVSNVPSRIMPNVRSPGKISPQSMQLGRSIVGGVAEPMTLGYYDRLLSDRDKALLSEAIKNYPGANTAASVVGSLSPRGPLNLFRGAKGAMSGWKAGALGGLAYDPGGKDVINIPDRLVNAAVGLGVGGTLDLVGGAKNALSGGFKARQDARGPGFSREVKGAIDKTISDARANYVKPRANEVKSLVQGKKTDGVVSGESVEIGPTVIDQLGEHFPQYAAKLRGRLVAGPDGQPRVKIPGQQALKLRQKLDELADYRKQRALSDDAIAGSEKIKGLADIFRGRLSDISPKVGPIQDDLSKGIRAIGDLERRAVDPIATARVQPGIKGGDTRSLINTVEDMAGSDAISKTGRNIRMSERMEPKIPSELGQVLPAAGKSAALVAGAGARGVDKVLNAPIIRSTNPRDASILQTIQPRSTDGGADDWEPVRSSPSDERAASAKKLLLNDDILAGIEDPEDPQKNKVATEAHKKVAPTLYGRKRKK